jgi:hypothetical protein
MIYKMALLCLFVACSASLATAQKLSPLPRKTKERSVPASAGRTVSACALLASKEIDAVQGEPVKETISNLQLTEGMNLLQCVFHTPTPAKSVSLEVATVNHSNSSAATPRKFWRNQFHASDLREKELPTDAKPAKGLMIEPQNEERKPRRIDGVGEEAYWVGNRVTGILYVLQGDVFLRLSVGGIREESARLEKSKALARAAIRRL